MKLLVTGATGFVGTNLILKLHEKYEIVALVRKNSNIEMIKPCCTIYHYDENLENLIEFFRSQNFDGIIHLATNYQSVHHPQNLPEILQANITFGTYLLEACKHQPPKFFINTLTFSQFSNSQTYTPSSLYDATKQAFFDIICFYQEQIPTKFCNLLLYNTYGPNDPRPKIFNLWQRYTNSQEVLKMSEGIQEIDISHIDDVIRGFDLLIQLNLKTKQPKNIIYTLQNQRYNLRDLANLYMQATNTKINIKWGAKPYRICETLIPISEPSLPKLPGWNPKIKLQEGIKEIYGK
ncbi:NAD-dependent epimerase/dehydratase family protein [Helicobacter anatolicus]|uniref:NAD-dependent epimerase/dehydratase family protein n=1 Tax=Helicobacter anatolicus TaxID=2905874 RepID=UPI001E59C9C8|nr:NAD(P)-dependent oxidoreductase [Helicobacter anatolicus]MCE3040290.1 NAD(P)-dependent oxidoreductase [Helicobacter anatolicus]